MTLLKKIALTLSLLTPLTLHAQECKSPLIDWSDYDKTLAALKTEYHNENFSTVENTLDCLMKSKKVFSSGKLGSTASYWFFRNEMRAPGASEEDELRIKKWKATIKNSPYAKFAEFRLLYAQAWNARGQRFGNQTSENQADQFKEKLLLAEAAIRAKDNPLKNTAISYNLLMVVTLDLYDTKASAEEAFNTGVASWPNYYDFYHDFLARLVPKWRGSWDKVDAFINQWDEKFQEQEKKSLYARLYYNVHNFNQKDPHTTKADWGKLKPSLVALYTTYPASVHFEIAASYACIYSDYDFYTQLITTHKVKDSQAWLTGSSLAKCKTKFASQANK